jgi:uncharacterized protein
MHSVVKNEFIAPVSGAGLGLRRSLMEPLLNTAVDDINFMEVAPENWIHLGGRLAKKLRAYSERFPLLCHGLSLSIGSPAPLNTELLTDIKGFMHTHNVRYYSEHLSYCSDAGQLYDLLPIPFTEEAVAYVAGRIRQAQDILGQRIAIENSSYYFAPQQEMSESEFINAVISAADCALLLDVNNVYVNSINHQYDPVAFLKSLPGERTAYIHIAGHFDEAEDLRIDTHGAPVIPSVWALLDKAYELFGVKPSLLERDFNIPPVPELLAELQLIKNLQHKHLRLSIAERAL